MSTTLKYANGDLFIDQVTGKARTVTDIEKCAQDIAQVLMTNKKQPANRATKAFPMAYGSELATIEQPTFFSGLIGKPMVARKIQEAVQSLMDLQDIDPNITDGEKIDHIGRLIVETYGPTDYLYFIECVVKAGATTPAVTNLQAIAVDHQFPMTSGTTNRE